ncbi:MAG TPA: sigma-70 family RNA polymerase sigma factor [Myxococcota bacterium]|jgi:RNA polymerase sigma-70 factor (ECF subfamily)|nr:sigma-70 family RNA polymerase sigma factor [Myxococcota bacterium]
MKDQRAEPAPADLELVHHARKGDDAAFKTLVERYQRRVYGIAYGMLHNADDAMDVTQEAFIKVHRYIGSFQGTSSFYTWLYRITVNLAIDLLRKGSKMSTVDFDDALDHASEAQEATGLLPGQLGTSPTQELERHKISDEIQAALAKLSDNHRAVIVMRELEGLSYKDMARAMKCSKGTIMSRLHHARRKMQAMLRAKLEEGTEVG